MVEVSREGAQRLPVRNREGMLILYEWLKKKKMEARNIGNFQKVVTGRVEIGGI